MAINESADWNAGEINISPDNIDVSINYVILEIDRNATDHHGIKMRADDTDARKTLLCPA